MVQRPVTAIGGGFPIVKNGVFLGGLGISGGTTAQDMAVGHGALRAAGLEQ
ncbi:MAG: heme-binding protein [Veillonella sp.]|nr:heme-binding protein [Veillonella sp.]